MGASPTGSSAPSKYTPIGRLGGGGMADVYLALMREVDGTEKLAVMKRLRDSSDMELSAMFFDEARLSARLKHPNIVHTYEVGEENGESFIAMEYLEGQPLSEVFAQLKSRSQAL